MHLLADTGILLRLLNRSDTLHSTVRESVRLARRNGATPVTALQNLAEFWNVCTRPSTARGGLGLSPVETERRLHIVERVFTLLPDSPATYVVWRQLLLSHGVMGVQTHDARLVALMMVHGIDRILTLNPADFARYSAISPITPDEVVGASPRLP
jgi:predicted nucleic acid-binding protein